MDILFHLTIAIKTRYSSLLPLRISFTKISIKNQPPGNILVHLISREFIPWLCIDHLQLIAWLELKVFMSLTMIYTGYYCTLWLVCTMRCRYISQVACFSTIDPGLINANVLWTQKDSPENVIEFHIKQLAIQFIEPEIVVL